MCHRVGIAGHEFVTISPQIAERNRALIEKRKFGFEILSDPDYTHRPEPEETVEALRRVVAG